MKRFEAQEHRIVLVLIFRCAKQFYVLNMQEQSKTGKKSEINRKTFVIWWLIYLAVSQSGSDWIFEEKKIVKLPRFLAIFFLFISFFFSVSFHSIFSFGCFFWSSVGRFFFGVFFKFCCLICLLFFSFV